MAAPVKTVEVKALPKVPEGKGGEDDQDQLSNHAQLLELTVSHDLCFPPNLDAEGGQEPHHASAP